MGLLARRRFRGLSLHAIHEPLLARIHESGQFCFLFWSEDLHHFRAGAGVLHDKLSHGLALLRRQLADFRFVEVPVHDLLPGPSAASAAARPAFPWP